MNRPVDPNDPTTWDVNEHLRQALKKIDEHAAEITRRGSRIRLLEIELASMRDKLSRIAEIAK